MVELPHEFVDRWKFRVKIGLPSLRNPPGGILRPLDARIAGFSFREGEPCSPTGVSW